MPNKTTAKPSRRSDRPATKTKSAKSVRKNYMSSRPNRVRAKPISFTPCQASNTYNRGWPPQTVDVTAAVIEVNLNAGNDTRTYVEELGDKGAKWHLCTQLVGRTVEDGDKTQPFKAGYFYSFSGAHTVDSIYVDQHNGNVYVIEAKGTKKGSAANLITRQNGKTQGTFAYLDEVADEMSRSGDALKAAAAAKITGAAPGKLYYVGVHTTYSADAQNRVMTQQPKSIYNNKR